MSDQIIIKNSPVWSPGEKVVVTKSSNSKPRIINKSLGSTGNEGDFCENEDLCKPYISKSYISKYYVKNRVYINFIYVKTRYIYILINECFYLFIYVWTVLHKFYIKTSKKQNSQFSKAYINKIYISKFYISFSVPVEMEVKKNG